jgi:hypothetical protein
MNGPPSLITDAALFDALGLVILSFLLQSPTY